MLPEEIYANNASSEKFKYVHPLNHMPVDDGSLRARLAYDLMVFMKRPNCNYFINPEALSEYSLNDSDDEIDIMIVDGFYKEAEILIEQRLIDDPECEKTLFQKSFTQHLKEEYEKLLARENKILKSNPKNINALLNKGVALTNLNREEEALSVADIALRIDPENLNILSNKAYIEKLLGYDDLHDQTLAMAYNISAKIRSALLEEQEANLLENLGYNFIVIHSPSAFESFNQYSGFNE